METLVLVLLLLAAVLLSSIINEVFPTLSPQLVQIALGLIITLVSGTQVDIFLNEPELFLVLFIAPLLYDEARSADKAELWLNIKPVLAIAIGLVVVTMLLVGFATHALMPSIGLASAFALGAALGPTDAVAVASLSEQTDIPKRIKCILKGESLINDASGIVSFQFALGAAITGAFSLQEAGFDFLLEFAGGITIGIIMGWLGNRLVRTVRSWGLDSTTFHVLFELFMPFIVFLTADSLGTSGILAAVAAGMLNHSSARTMGPAVSRMNIVSTSVWRVLSFALNGIVFVLLGTQLPRAMQHTWENVTINNGYLIFIVVVVTLIVILTRFVWVFAMERARGRWSKKGERHRICLDDVLNSAIATLAGPKGTITLAVILTMPRTVPQQQLITFIACGVILFTLLLATYVVPLLAPSKETDDQQKARDAETMIDILRTVSEELSARQTDQTRTATQMVLGSLNSRIDTIKDRHDIANEINIPLRVQTLEWEQDFVTQLIENDEVDPIVAHRYLARVKHSEDMLERRHIHWNLRRTYIRIRRILRATWQKIAKGIPLSTPSTDAIHELQIRSYQHVIDRLNEEITSDSSEERTEDLTTLLVERQRMLDSLKSTLPSISKITADAQIANSIRILALKLELDEIENRYDAGALTHASAKRFRENVSLMFADFEDTI